MYRLHKVEHARLASYAVDNGFSWIAVTKIEHQSTVHNMIVHLGGRVYLSSLQPCQQSFPVMYFLNPRTHDWKIVLYIANMYRLHKVEHARLASYAVDNGFSWIAVTKIEHQSTVLNMIEHRGGGFFLDSLPP